VRKPGTVQTGILDFVKHDGEYWWIVDFKSSRPMEGQTETEFLEQQTAYYRPQLLAYEGMLAQARDIDRERIRIGLYFTSIQQWHETGSH
jgi:ATP-dependent exoDNAse (exonuclease V) beta subunit